MSTRNQTAPNYYSVTQYLQQLGLEFTKTKTQEMGTKARKLSEARDIEIKIFEKTNGDKVRQYHKSILHEALKSTEEEYVSVPKARIDVDLHLNADKSLVPSEVLSTNLKALGRIPSIGESLYIKHKRYKVEDIHTTLEEDLVPCYVELFLRKVED